MGLLKQLRLFVYHRKWRKLDPHNATSAPDFICDVSKVQVGKRTYGVLNAFIAGYGSNKLVIGSYCSIGPGVWFLVSGEHNNPLKFIFDKAESFIDYLEIGRTIN